MSILGTGSIKGCGNAKVVKTLVAMTTALCHEWSVPGEFLGWGDLALGVTASLGAGVELSGGRSQSSQATCVMTFWGSQN